MLFMVVTEWNWGLNWGTLWQADPYLRPKISFSFDVYGFFSDISNISIILVHDAYGAK